MESSSEIINPILELELEMFLSVNSRGPASCQQHPDRFRVMRGAQFSAWSAETLESYLGDLKHAVKRGDNLMTLKYARMENLIPELNSNPLIDEILNVQIKWQKSLAEEFPRIVGSGRKIEDSNGSIGGASFARYLRCELETYSDKTLELLHADVMRHVQEGASMTKRVYERMVKGLGYQSMEEAEAQAGS